VARRKDRAGRKLELTAADLPGSLDPGRLISNQTLKPKKTLWRT
jgi:hypothetical protein